jgi:hypothetical protein
MATVTAREHTFNRVEADRKVRHPLHTVRGYIRRYVVSEGLALTILYVGLVFWIGLFIDWWPWKLFSFDWLWTADEMSGIGATKALRGAILFFLVLGLAALLIFKVVRRLFTEFSDASVALLLEKRYPRQLGDRLITAVELADPTLAHKYGYSQAMVDHTIRDAADRVGQLPVHEIFRWGLLRFKWALAIVATIGFYFLAAAGWCIWTGSGPVDYFLRFNQTSATWGERNLLLASSYWPPETYIELIRFPSSGTLGVPRDEKRGEVKVRYVHWVIASSKAPRGWRPLEFGDLAELMGSDLPPVSLSVDWGGWVIDLDDLDPEVPHGAIPPEWNWQMQSSGFLRGELAKPKIQKDLDGEGQGKARNTQTRDKLYELLNWRNWTVDKIEMQLEYKPPAGSKVEAPAAVMKRTDPAAYEAFQKILSRLQEMQAAPSMGRTLRGLRKPAQVTVERITETGSGTSPTLELPFRKFGWNLDDLKESCKFRFTANLEDPSSFSLGHLADDYTTPWHNLELVPPPLVDQMQIDKEEPAYRYYRYLDDPNALKDKRQELRSISVDTSGVRMTMNVALGSNVTITGHADRKLTRNAGGRHGIRVAEPEAGRKREDPSSITVPADVKLEEDQQTFSFSFDNVRQTLEFDLDLVDENGVKGRRPVMIVPLKDDQPRIKDLGLSVPAREMDISGSKHYVITPDAMLKLRGRVSDDHGIADLEYKYELKQIDFQDLFSDPTKEKKEDSKEESPKDTKQKQQQQRDLVRLVVQGLQSPMGGYPFYAAPYFSALSSMPVGSIKPPPRIETVPLARVKDFLHTKNDLDLTADQIDRLLHVQPANRELLVKVVDSTDPRTLLPQLKEENKTEGFLREAMGFAGITGDERRQLDALVSSDPGAVITKVAAKLKGSAAEAKKLLQMQPEKLILHEYDLSNEDRANGFDVQEYLRFVKETDQRHYELRLWVVATDTNVLNGSGVRRGVAGNVTEASLPASFLIISENELLTLMRIDQRRYADLLHKAVTTINEARGALEAQVSDFRRAPDDPTKLLLRLEAVNKSVRDGAVLSKALQTRFSTMLGEMQFNRMKKNWQDTLKNGVVDPMERLNMPNLGGFAIVESHGKHLRDKVGPLADRKDAADRSAVQDTELMKLLEQKKDVIGKDADSMLNDVDLLIKDLNAVLAVIRNSLSRDQLIEDLVYIESEHRQLTQLFTTYQKELVDWLDKIAGGK